MHCELKITCDSTAELAKVAAAVAGTTGRGAEADVSGARCELAGHERLALIAAGWGRHGQRWVAPDGKALRESVPDDLTLLREVAAECAKSPREDASASTKAPPIPGPTALDGVVGMLLRLGFGDDAEELAGGATPADVLASMAGADSSNARVCIAALEALDRGELSVEHAAGPRSGSLFRRVARERDEARADAIAAMQQAHAEIRRLGGERDDLVKQLSEARASSKNLACGQAELTRQLDEARAEAAALRDRVAELEEWTAADLMHAHVVAAPKPGAIRTADEIARDMVTAPRDMAHGGFSPFIRDEFEGAALYAGTTRGDAYRTRRLVMRIISRLITKVRFESAHDEPDTGSTLRPAEDIAREHVSDAEHNDFTNESEATLFDAFTAPASQGDVGDLRRAIAGLIERSRAEGKRAPVEPKEAPPGMRIERREDGEHIIGASGGYSDCIEFKGLHICSFHFNGEHVATGAEDCDGARLILARWPIAPAQDEPRVVGVDMGTGPARVAAVVLRREPSGEVKPLATFEGDDAEQKAREFIAGLPAEDAICMTGTTSHPEALTSAPTPEPTRPLLSIGTVYFASREGTAEERADLVASLTRHLQATLNGQGSERGDVYLLANVDGSVRVEMPRSADPRAVLATVAELLGLPPPEYEIAREAALAHERGVADGERRAEEKARATARGLTTSWTEDAKSWRREALSTGGPHERAAMRQPCPVCRQGRMSPAGDRSLPTCDTCGAEQIVSGIQRAAMQQLIEPVAYTEAMASVAPADRPLDRAALLALAEGWRTRARRLRCDASPGADGLDDYGEAKGLGRCAADLRRLLGGPGGGERATLDGNAPTPPGESSGHGPRATPEEGEGTRGQGGGADSYRWRGIEHEVAAHRSDLDTWVVEAIDEASEGEIYAAHFSGPHAEFRAREYAALMSAPVANPGGSEVAPEGKAPPAHKLEPVERDALRAGGWRQGPWDGRWVRPVGESQRALFESDPHELADLRRAAVKLMAAVPAAERQCLAAGQRWLDGKRRPILIREEGGLLVAIRSFGQRLTFFPGAAAPDEWAFDGADPGREATCIRPADGLIGVDAGGGL